MILGALAGGLGSAVLVAIDRGEDPAPPGNGVPKRPAAGDRAEWRATAEHNLRAALTAETPQRQGLAVDALAAARVPAGAPLLYLALKASSPDVRVKAARALGELALPDSAPKVREALAEAGAKLKVELAAVLYRLGDKDARAILQHATEDAGGQDAGGRLTAAVALAEAGDEAGRAALAEQLETAPPGRDPWRRAAAGLAQLGDANARTLLEGELAQPDAARAVGAAELLARAGDAKARAQLARNLADPDFARPGKAAVALARLGDKRALGWVARGLASSDAEERQLALAVCGALAADAAVHAGAVAKLAASDPDLRVRMTAEAVLLGL
jgi:HEAT repeat protein